MPLCVLGGEDLKTFEFTGRRKKRGIAEVMSVAKLTFQVSTALLVLVFAFAGLVKVAPGVSPAIHSEMSGKFRSYARVPPVDLLRLDPDAYMKLVGLTELACVGLMMFGGRRKFGMFGTWTLFVVMVGAVYTHFSVGDSIQDTTPALVVLALVLTRLYSMKVLERSLKLE